MNLLIIMTIYFSLSNDDYCYDGYNSLKVYCLSIIDFNNRINEYKHCLYGIDDFRNRLIIFRLD